MTTAVNADPLLKDRPEKSNIPERRYTLRLSKEAAETLDWISQQRGGVTSAEVIRRALGTERLLLEQIRNGFTITLEKSGHRTKELILR